MRPIKVKELIETLKKYDEEDYVGLSTDSGHSSFSLIEYNAFIVDGIYLKAVPGLQKTFYTAEEFKDSKDGYIEDCRGKKIKLTDLRRCIILFGSNKKIL